MKSLLKYLQLLVAVVLFLVAFGLSAQDAHDLWLDDRKPYPVKVKVTEKSSLLSTAEKELKAGWSGLPGATVELVLKEDKAIWEDGFRIAGDRIEATTESGILYGVFEVLRRQKTEALPEEGIVNPSYKRRLLNHWDNLDGSVERGYAGRSIFWKGKDSLAVTAEDRERWTEYARANASIGINGSVVNNVNASPLVLSRPYLERVEGMANVLRPYGIRVYLSVNFASPKVLGGLRTADPLDKKVQQWWKDKADEIYKRIPDFGGFLVKANSEGEPGPQEYGRGHWEGANTIAQALKPHKGIVMWRAFVYEDSEEDRAKQAYSEFKPLDGQFADNVIVQVKNGPIDFQPREPFSPLFGAMEKTPLMAEVQITQEYLGHSRHLVYLAPMWEEFLKSETYQKGPGSSVAKVTDGRLHDFPYTAIAGVANTGRDTNWTGHLFGQANWYAFGRLAWNSELTSEQIADEWIKLTFHKAAPMEKEKNIFSNEWKVQFLNPIKEMMMQSREAAVDYMMPLGLHHLFAPEHHYGPGPWWAPENVRKDWTAPYFHNADTLGIGFDRTTSGSGATQQYHEPLASQWNDPETTPEMYLLWFHHLPWDYQMKNGETLWNALCYRYQEGVDRARNFQRTWNKVAPYIDAKRYGEVDKKLREQVRNAGVWKDGVLLYFQKYSKRPFPRGVEPPIYDLDSLMEADMEKF